MTRSELRDHFNDVCAYFLVELCKHLVNAFEECCDELEDLDDIGEILPWSIMWEDSNAAMLHLTDGGALCVQVASVSAGIVLHDDGWCECPAQRQIVTYRLLRFVREVRFELYCGCDDCIRIAADYITDRAQDPGTGVLTGMHSSPFCPYHYHPLGPHHAN